MPQLAPPLCGVPKWMARMTLQRPLPAEFHCVYQQSILYCSLNSQ
uniref:Uncharacterized protein n=1 Tax=Anguilla anguilla TaxID=7936 RepID=A0A0E9RI19_ANGAN